MNAVSAPTQEQSKALGCSRCVSIAHDKPACGRAMRKQHQRLPSSLQEASFTLTDECALQADVVRELKEGRGLSNADAEVQAAVQELQRRKNAAERIQATLENGSPVVDQLPEPAASTI